MFITILCIDRDQSLIYNSPIHTETTFFPAKAFSYAFTNAFIKEMQIVIPYFRQM